MRNRSFREQLSAFLVLLLALVFATGCATYRVETLDTDPEFEYRGGPIHAFAWGVWYSPQSVLAECQGRGINDVKIKRNLVHNLVSIFTLGFWMPMEVQFRCRAPRADAGEFPESAVRGEEIPTFDWPPPKPTTRMVLDRSLLFGAATTLGEVAQRLTTALARAGYSEHSFYSVPGGFALATRLEQIEFDGTPKPEPGRWSIAMPPRKIFSLVDYVHALFTAPEGHYRVIVFVVNDLPFALKKEPVSRKEALAWLGGGLNRLPHSIAELPLAERHAGTALIYQYLKVGYAPEPIANPDGAAPADRQLARSGILAALKE